MVRRIYVEKRPGLRQEAEALRRELSTVLGVEGLRDVRILERYDVEGLDEAAFGRAVRTVFSEPQVDDIYEDLPADLSADGALIAVEPLPGQFDQRADSAESCIQLLTQGERPRVRTARIYALSGRPGDLDRIRGHLINPVEAREADLAPVETLEVPAGVPAMVETVRGFTRMDGDALSALLGSMGLAMDLDDLRYLRDYYRDEERRDPTVTEIRVVDTYWSDHCRHTTFSTHLDRVEIGDPRTEAAYRRYLSAREEVYGAGAAARPQTLMDLATIGAKVLKRRGLLRELDESEEVNACSIHVPVTVDGQEQDWLVLFKNETHNHPTEIEPFGGAATCIGGCIRDPLSGRAYVYQAMRVTGCGDPRTPVSETVPGRLPQRKLAQTAAAGYSSYGNQIGLATGLVSEVYHPGYVAKHMEVGAVVGAVPAADVVRERPAPGDVVILLGGRTGRDGIGGATGSSKSHDRQSLTTMASEVQKGNAPEERKIQRLFRDPAVTALIKRCNDFGAGGVSVAVGELADGLEIDLDAVRKKYEGLDGTELAISESQERMAVVVAPEDVETFIGAADREDLEAYPVAVVTETPRMLMRWRGETIVDLSRAFLDTHGAPKRASVSVPAGSTVQGTPPLPQDLRSLASDLRCASRRGLAERFDSTVGAGSVLMPFGGRSQRSPAQVMAALLPVPPGQETDTCTVMSWGFDPDRMAADPFGGARESVIVSVAKLVAAGCDHHRAYLTFQEYFERLRTDPERWGKPFSALLGALDAQMGLGIGAVGGKDSMSGSFLDMDVPPTLISFAIAPSRAGDVISPESKEAGHPVYLFGQDASDLEDLARAWEDFRTLCQTGKVRAAWAVEHGAAEAVMEMSFGNGIGFRSDPGAWIPWYEALPGRIVAELTEDVPSGLRIGVTTADPQIRIGTDAVPIADLLALSEGVLEDVYPNAAVAPGQDAPVLSAPPAPIAAPKIGIARPRALIPVFPGTNCEYDSQRAVLRAGLDAEIFVINDRSARRIAQSAEAFAAAVRRSQIVFLPGGFSGGDEPDGSAKLIAAFFRGAQVSDAVMDLLQERDGLMLGICNGFQALIKLGLVPYGEIRDMDRTCPTLSYNVIGRHQSRIVRTRIASVRSPWLSRVRVGDVYSVPISHGEGRFLCPPDLLGELRDRGQIATQYADPDGVPSMDVHDCPSGSTWAVEGLLSPDGRVFGKMGHSERVGPYLYRNVPGRYEMGLFEAAGDYFRI